MDCQPIVDRFGQPLFSGEIQSIGNVETQPVGEMPVTKAPTVLGQQVVCHLEFTVVDCLFHSLDCCFDLHFEPLFYCMVPLYHNQEECQGLFGIVDRSVVSLAGGGLTSMPVVV